MSLSLGWCFPQSSNFNLSDQANGLNSNTFRIQILNKTTTGSTTLSTLAGNFVPVVLMTVPVINNAKKSFNYTIKQIRGYT